MDLNTFLERDNFHRNRESGELKRYDLMPYQHYINRMMLKYDKVCIRQSRQIGMTSLLMNHCKYLLLDNFTPRKIMWIGHNGAHNHVMNALHDKVGEKFIDTHSSNKRKISIFNGNTIEFASNVEYFRGVDMRKFDLVIVDNVSTKFFDELVRDGVFTYHQIKKLLITGTHSYNFNYPTCKHINLHWSVSPYWTENRINDLKLAFGNSQFDYEIDIEMKEQKVFLDKSTEIMLKNKLMTQQIDVNNYITDLIIKDCLSLDK